MASDREQVSDGQEKHSDGYPEQERRRVNPNPVRGFPLGWTPCDETKPTSKVAHNDHYRQNPDSGQPPLVPCLQDILRLGTRDRRRHVDGKRTGAKYSCKATA